MGRRNFIVWLSVGVASFTALALDLLQKVFLYILGPRTSVMGESKLIENRIRNLEATDVLERKRYERVLNSKIFICELKDLNQDKGIPFVDYDLKPALAFMGTKGKPVLLTSVCPHLGCTIQSKLENGRLLCPCHISYFDLDTGRPLEGPTPLNVPLKKIPFVVENDKVYIIKNA